MLAVVVACKGDADRPSANLTVETLGPPRTADSAATVSASAWPAALGGLLVVGTGPGQPAVVLLPSPEYSADDLARARGAALELAGADGAVVTASLAAIDTSEVECAAWPTAMVAPADAGASLSAWSLAWRAGAGRAVPAASLGALTGRDSVRLASDVARAASSAPSDTNAVFRGLPIRVGSAVRMAAAGPGEIVVAEVSRSVAQEATPLEERLTFVAERAAAAPSWRVVWSQRVTGSEESIESTAFVGATQLGDGTVVVVLHRETASGTRYELLVREAAGGWRLAWTGPWSGC